MKIVAQIIIASAILLYSAIWTYKAIESRDKELETLRLQIKNHKQVADAAAEQCWDDAVFRGFRGK